MQEARNLKEYKKDVDDALQNTFLRSAMDKFAVAYRSGRANAFAGMDVDGLIAEIAAAKDAALARMDALFEEFKENASKAGVYVHLAETAGEANAIIARIARDNDVKKIVKSKSMTAEETLLNHHLEAEGFEVTETDLGEWIIQLRGEGPSHMVMPAIHLSRYQVADLFTEVTGHKQESEIERLVKVARRELRQKYVAADMGISGANFALADTGTIGLVGLLAGFVIGFRRWRAQTPAQRQDAFPYVLALALILFPLNSHFAIYGAYTSSLIWFLVGLWAATWRRPAMDDDEGA